ncbi:MAG: hypothetical protein J6Z36_04810, partial [Clostridia bacterium]|nr:hypothetical protein [Clostridia bacterium]
LSLFLVNLIPAHPLDGGRALFCIIAKFWNRRRAWVVCRVLSAVFCLLLIGLFFYTVFHGVNVSLLFFALFLGAGCLESDKYGYERMKFDLTDDFKRGLEERRVAVSAEFTLQKTIPLLRREKYLILDVFDEAGNFMVSVRQEELCRLLEEEELCLSLGEVINT